MAASGQLHRQAWAALLQSSGCLLAFAFVLVVQVLVNSLGGTMFAVAAASQAVGMQCLQGIQPAALMGGFLVRTVNHTTLHSCAQKLLQEIGCNSQCEMLKHRGTMHAAVLIPGLLKLGS